MKYRFLRFPDGKPKAVTFSYDDGCRWDIDLARILKEYGVKGTFNINSGNAGKSDWYLSFDEIREHIIGNGHEVAVHGEFHRAQGVVRPIDGIQDVLNCRLKLEKEFGMIIRGMAYPNSGIRKFINNSDYKTVKKYLTDLDIVYSRSLCGDNNDFYLPDDWHNWIPTIHHDNENSLKWAKEFTQLEVETGYVSYRFPRLFYVWGHSFEFDKNKNWEHLHDLLKILSGKEDIWYATNIEIYEYTAAFNSLSTSADGSIIHNPSAIDVWFMQDGENYCIKAGETLKINR